MTPSDASYGLGSPSDECLMDVTLCDDAPERNVAEEDLDTETDPRSDSEVEPTYLA